jgi:hypothetical protein
MRAIPIVGLQCLKVALAFIQDMHGVCTGPLQHPLSGERSDHRLGQQHACKILPVHGELAELSNRTKKV